MKPFRFRIRFPAVLGLIVVGLASSPISQAADRYWDTSGGLSNGVGGAGAWTASSTTWSTTPTGDATLVTASQTADALIFQGTAGTVIFGASLNAASLAFNTTGYTFASNATARNLQGPITLAAGVNLTFTSTINGGGLGFNSGTTTISGTTGSTLTLDNTKGAFTFDLRNFSTLGSTAPITITASGDATSTTIGNSASLGSINAAIANSSAVPLTLSSARTSGTTDTRLIVNGRISGSQGVIFSAGTLGRVELGNTNDYVGETRFTGIAGADKSTTVGLVKLNVNNAISTVSDVVMGYSSGKGENLDLAGKNQTISSLTSNEGGTGSIFNSSTTTSTLTINGAATSGSFGLQITDGADSSRKVALTRSGTGTTTLANNANTYTGATNVTGGKLVVDGNISTSILTSVSGTGTLGGTGTIGAATILAGGTLAPGNSIGTLNFSQTLTLAGVSNFEVDPTLGMGLNADRVNVTSAVTYGGTLNVTYAGSSADFTNGMLFNLFDAGSFAGTFGNLSLPILSDGLTWRNDLASNGSITVVPEPRTALLLGGLGMLVLLRRRS
ncbi:MAG: hypothetical protein RLZZ214_4045 [Verrucomicrobiota bacterium]|jgi:autotransporter-associated beta strand protein